MDAKQKKRLYVVTPKGAAELTGATSALPAAELKLLVQIDGLATAGEIAARTRDHDPAKVGEMLDRLARGGFIADPDATASINVGDFFQEAQAGVDLLKSNGFYVRIARRGTERHMPAKGQKPTVLAIEDDPQLAKLLRLYLKMEEFTVRIAATRAEIDRALAQPPLPDLVILDVMLPDSDGFDLLSEMRENAATKNVPVVMATAKASREAVLEGLRRGADGYVTKPYDMEVLLKTVRTVLGPAKK